MEQPLERAQVIIIGAGPAALAMAQGLTALKIKVALLCPSWPAAWPNTYGVWEDELEPWARACVHMRWERPLVRFGRGWRRLDRAYVRLDNAKLKALLCPKEDELEVIQGWALEVIHEPRTSVVRYRVSGDEQRVAQARAKLVIDATGHQSALLRYEGQRAPSFQTAFGIKVKREALAKSKWRLPEAGDMALMDYAGPSVPGQPATFLYAMSLPDDEIFIEETTLSARPLLSEQVLRERLWARLGVEVEASRWLEREWCVIPMGTSLPALDQRTLGYGGAASMVHPASGYQLARTLSWRGALCALIAQGLKANTAPEQIAKMYWATLWSEQRQRQHALYLYGLESLLAMSDAQLISFFDGFFDEPEAAGRYLSGTLSPGELARVMLKTFGKSEAKVKLKLMAPAGSVEHGAQLLRALSPSLVRRAKAGSAWS